MLLTPGVLSTGCVSLVCRMPPMTVVMPSATCTCVSARCVLIDGLPLTARLKSGSAVLEDDAHDDGVGAP